MKRIETQAIETIAVNYHLWKPCNLKCRFCFATFREVDGTLPLEEAKKLLRKLREAGFLKINFAGGEPTLCPNLGQLLEEARRLGFVVSIVTNGARLGPLLDTHAAYIDWVGFSIDSYDEKTQAALGRGFGNYVRCTLRLVERVRALRIKIKLNTVITRLNHQEDLSELVSRVRPARWKVFQVMFVKGQNDGSVEDLLISAEQFHGFIERHQHLSPVAEDNDTMQDSYVMIDPLGRFYGDSGGIHQTSEAILEVGIHEALRQVGFKPEKLVARGGLYDW